MTSSRPILGAVLLAVASAAGAPVARRAAELRLPAVARHNGLAGRATDWGCWRKASADRRWIDLLQYCGDGPFWLERGSRLPGLADAVTDDDPTFVRAYLYGGAMLYWTCDRPDAAASLLEKGIRYNPAQPRLQEYLAAFTYSRQKDLRGEIGVLERLAAEPSAPFILRRILANAYQRQGRMDLARAIWADVLATSEDPDERRWAEAKMQRFRVIGAGVPGR